jgi:hypothetical protein
MHNNYAFNDKNNFTLHLIDHGVYTLLNGLFCDTRSIRIGRRYPVALIKSPAI